MCFCPAAFDSSFPSHGDSGHTTPSMFLAITVQFALAPGFSQVGASRWRAQPHDSSLHCDAPRSRRRLVVLANEVGGRWSTEALGVLEASRLGRATSHANESAASLETLMVVDFSRARPRVQCQFLCWVSEAKAVLMVSPLISTRWKVTSGAFCERPVHPPVCDIC